MPRVAIALGSNLGDRRGHLDEAVMKLRQEMPDLTASLFFETAFVGTGDQPPYLNGAAVGTWRSTARALLDRLLAIEAEGGRTRPFPEAPRTLDLDLILFGDEVIAEPDLVVPHPRFRSRAFVLEPLAAIAPALRDPVTGRTIRELLGILQEPFPCASH